MALRGRVRKCGSAGGEEPGVGCWVCDVLDSESDSGAGTGEVVETRGRLLVAAILKVP